MRAICLAILAACAVVSNAFGDETVFGYCEYKNREFDSLNVNGCTLFQNVTVHGTTTANGALEANNLFFGSCKGITCFFMK
jgi:hypothetical protein